MRKVYYRLRYTDVLGNKGYYLNIGFPSEESAELERKKLLRHRENLEARGISWEELFKANRRIPLCFYDFTIEETFGREV